MESRSEHNQRERLHVLIKGLVQGVGFRAFVLRTGNSLELVGWVRNRWDGSVEAVAEGERDKLDEFLRFLWKGPRASHVEDITVEWQPASGEFSGFFVHPSI